LAADAAPALLYLPTLPAPGGRVALAAEDSHYVARVCRARVGESVEGTDGSGRRALLRLIEVRDGVTVEVESVADEPRGRRAWVLCGAPEGERADWLVEKLAELGIERFVPVDCSRAAWRLAAGRKARWERLAIAALRQSRRTRLLTVDEPAPLERALAALPETRSRWLADASGAVPVGPTAVSELSVVLVGPSPGLDEREREAVAAAGFRSLRLAEARLRTETAALAWAALWSSGSG